MTHLERARAWMIDNWLWENRQEATESLAAQFAQVTNEAYERAAQWHNDQAAELRAINNRRNVEADGGMMDHIRWDLADAHDKYAKAIRSLKVSP